MTWPGYARALRWAILLVVESALVSAAFAVCRQPAAALEPPDCQTPREISIITGYVRGHHSPATADGTSVWSREWLVAANLAQYPLGSTVWIDDLGYFRVADTGLLGPNHLDVLVDTESEAYALTGRRLACRVL